MIRVGVLKTGNIGCSTVLELLFDERAERKDITVRVVSSGAQMSKSESEDVTKTFLEMNHDLILFATPNASAPGPKSVINALSGKKAIVISDAPAVKAKESMEEKGLGYILVKADAMIGARREFLDPTEVAIFNADILKVLAGTGVFRLIQKEVGRSIAAIKDGKTYLPNVVVDAGNAVEHAGYTNPYSLAKAKAAYEITEKVGEVNVRGCFVEKEANEYIQTVTAAHELLRSAALLVDEAREMEKQGDTVYRTPNDADGRLLKKTKLMEKPR